MRLLSWNMAHVEARWTDVANDDGLDVALLQEAVPPPSGLVRETVPTVDQRWTTAGGNRRFCAAVARLSNRVSLRPIDTRPLADAGQNNLGVSLPGTLAACELTHEIRRADHGRIDIRRMDFSCPVEKRRLDLCRRASASEGGGEGGIRAESRRASRDA